MGNILKIRLLPLAVIACLMGAPFFAPFAEAVQGAEQQPITVKEAIRNNSGHATVEGYVVGHTVSKGNFHFSGPFQNDFNLAIADQTEERSPENILPVQIPTAFRSQFGLKTNPHLIGKKLSVKGVLSPYFQSPGVTSVQFIKLAEDSGAPTRPYAMPIADARKRLHETVTIKGVVTADQSAIGGGKLSTFIQDDTAGINIFSSSQANFPELKEGMDVSVTGQITTYKGLTEIIPVPDGIKVSDGGAAVPDPHSLAIEELTRAEQADRYEGSLVKIKGFIEGKPDTPAGGGYNMTMIDQNYNQLTLRVMEQTNAAGLIEQGKWFEITGILSRYNALQLLPRKQEDIKRLDGTDDPPPVSEGEYESVVDRVVDGDTIHLKEPVLGATKVRYVNMDTPETYHTPKNERDENQLKHGNRAKTYLQSILSPGDKVTVKVGKEAKDSYGRLLAQVITEDGLNTNLELVKKGLASTYFIWPVGDEKDYELFQHAVKKAKDDQLGIWNPADPLIELPFEFRAREQGKGLTRYVGDSADKTYVTPEKWREVPVEKRIFFASPEEAEDAGYTKKENSGNISLRLLSMNDLHGKIDQQYQLDLNGDGHTDGTFGRMDYTAALLKERKAERKNTLLVHAGDMIGGSSPVSSLLQDEPTVDIMEEIGFDVGTVGNHEFDEGADELLRILNGGEHPEGKGTKGYDGQDFPLVCANCKLKSSGAGFLPPYQIFEVEGVPVAFIGVVTRSAADMVIPDGIKKIEFTDETKAVNLAVDELKAKGVRSIAVLAHMTASQNGTAVTGESAELANKADPEVDVIFAAHNHEEVNGETGGALIVQASEYGKAIGVVDVEIDRNTKDIVRKQADIEYVNQENIKPDPATRSLLDQYERIVGPIIGEKVGEAAHDMAGGYSNDGDTPLGNLIADGMKRAMNSDFALMNGGGIRQDLKKGPITWGDLFNIQPFGNVLVTLEIKGKDLYDIIDAQISPVYGPDYSISGFTYTWDPKTNKTADIFLENGSPIEKDRTYTITVNDFMASASGKKYEPISRLGKRPVTGPEDIEATVEFVKSFKEPISYQAEGRIKKVGADGGTGENPGNGDGGETPADDTGGSLPGHGVKADADASGRGTVSPHEKTGAFDSGLKALEKRKDQSGIFPGKRYDDEPVKRFLPNTAANLYNPLLFGILLFICGMFVYIWKKGSANL
ncbi:5'-nucleotidase C-terminal domain-containing protein [Bacillus sonorensis]|uniref:5'-nucleotidase C-terminal domain-containing protein n=1 Tax=Bacillus sonorensis TaxID=119858 RepID=UPI0022AA6995|nr:5'-nucleotidase C-terminal domain-containing protein [Bacillus sonorensis]